MRHEVKKINFNNDCIESHKFNRLMYALISPEAGNQRLTFTLLNSSVNPQCKHCIDSIVS